MTEQKLSEREMIRLVEEVSKLDEERRGMLEKSQIAKILQDLNLPEDLLDEALLRLKERNAKEKRRSTGIKWGVAVAFVAITLAGFLALSGINSSNELAKVNAAVARIALTQNSPESVTAVTTGNTVYVNTTLHDVPLNRQLPMQAKWISPDGKLFHENRWSTRPTTTSTWNTHAKCVIPEAAAKGEWQVELFVGGRRVVSKKFIVN